MKKIIVILIYCFIGYLQSSYGVQQSDWYRSGGDDASLKYSSSSQIKSENIKDLQQYWISHSGDIVNYSDTVQTNPISACDSVFTSTLSGFLLSIDIISGRENWRLKLPAPVARRGLTYKRNLFVPTSDGVYEVSCEGKILTKFGDRLSLLPPVVTNKSLITINIAANIESFNILENKKNWELVLNQDNVSPRIWSGVSYDDDTKILVIVTSNTGSLLENNSNTGGYANSIIAINAVDGKILWRFQEIRNDLKDLDVVGPPMIVSLQSPATGNKIIKVVCSLTKSGNIIINNLKTGKFIGKYHNVGNEIEFENPKPFSSTNFNKNIDITTINIEKNDYVKNKIRDSVFERSNNVTLKKPIVFFGLHGGAEWPGGAINPNSNTLFVPSNRYPWIIRDELKFNKKSSNQIINDHSKKINLYNLKCAICHGLDFDGFRQSEFEGDKYIPKLSGITKLMSYDEFINMEKFAVSHKYSKSQTTYDVDDKEVFKTRIINNLSFLQKIKFYITDYLNIIMQKIIQIDYKGNYNNDSLRGIDSSMLIEIYKDLNEIDNNFTISDFSHDPFWQMLNDKEGLPGSNPPWGFITAVNLQTGMHNWQIPFGEEMDIISAKNYPGSRNIGGVAVTNGGILFATGTTDSKVYAYDQKSGKILWSHLLPASGSSPPTVISYKGCDILFINSTGGRFVGFKEKSDSLIAFKLKTCEFKK